MEAGRSGAVALDVVSPSLGFAMKVAHITADDDEIVGNVGPNPRPVEAFVSFDDGFFWFTYEEFAKLPGENGRRFDGVIAIRYSAGEAASAL